jgi:hypothetical protein
MFSQNVSGCSTMKNVDLLFENKRHKYFRLLTFLGLGNGAFIKKSETNLEISGTETGNDNERNC